jgi:hypothetical protein
MKTSELTGAALDWAVAKAKGVPLYPSKQGKWMLKNYGEFNHRHGTPWWKPSTDWAQGGPIIALEGISVCPDEIAPWCAFFDHGTAEYVFYTGKTPLIAAMRCYVASKLGDEVEIPDAVTNPLR